MNIRNNVFKLIPIGISLVLFWGCNSSGPTEPKNKTAPVVTIVAPQEGFITNSVMVSILCNVNGKAIPPISKILQEGANQISCSAKDSAGNIGVSANRVVYKNSKILFVNQEAHVGGDGSSWEKAYSDLDSALLNKKTDTAGTQVWIVDGVYSPPLNGYRVPVGTRLYGGFPKIGPKFSLSQRDTIGKKTIIESKDETQSFMVINGLTDSINSNEVELNSLVFTGPSGNGVTISRVANAKISNCSFTNMEGFKAVFLTKVGGIFKNCKFNNNNIGNNLVEAWSIPEKGLIFENCVFENNKVSTSHIYATGEKSNISFLDSQFLDSIPAPDYTTFDFELSLARFRGCKVKGGKETIKMAEGVGVIDFDNSNLLIP